MKLVKAKAVLPAVLLAWCLSPFALAQTGFIQGTVTDENGEPIADATIRIEGMDVGRNYNLKTNQRGQYIHAGISVQGVYRVIAEKEGYQSDYIEGVRPSFSRDDERSIIDFVLREGQARALAFELTDEERERIQRQQQEAEQQREAVANFRAALNYGVEAFNAGRYDEAVQAFKNASDLDAKQSTAWFNLGISHLRMNQNEEALAALLKALELEPENPSFLQNVGSVHFRLGDEEKANEYYEKSVQVSAEGNPKEAAKGLFEMGVNFINSGRTQEAADVLRRVIELDPTHSEAYYQLGLVLVGQNLLQESLEALQKYLELAPSGENAEVARALIEQLQ